MIGGAQRSIRGIKNARTGPLLGKLPAALALIVLGVGSSAVASPRETARDQVRGDVWSVGVHPPIPRVSTLGVTRKATLVSYCWQTQSAAGEGGGGCADGIPGDPAHMLLWRPGRNVWVDLGRPAHDVQIQAVRFTDATGSRPHETVRVTIIALDQTGRHWKFRLPRRARRDTDLLIGAHFQNGDIEADIGIRRR
jgi:hypothetical protein